MSADFCVYSSVLRTGIWSRRMWSRLEVARRDVSVEWSWTSRLLCRSLKVDILWGWSMIFLHGEFERFRQEW